MRTVRQNEGWGLELNHKDLYEEYLKAKHRLTVSETYTPHPPTHPPAHTYTHSHARTHTPPPEGPLIVTGFNQSRHDPEG